MSITGPIRYLQGLKQRRLTPYYRLSQRLQELYMKVQRVLFRKLVEGLYLALFT